MKWPLLLHLSYMKWTQSLVGQSPWGWGGRLPSLSGGGGGGGGCLEDVAQWAAAGALTPQ
jgi:hypothetical protein